MPTPLTRTCLAAGAAVFLLPAAQAEMKPAEIVEASYDSGALPDGQSALTAKLQALLDRAGASPGVIDGWPGENVDEAIRNYEEMQGFEVDGVLDKEVWSALDKPEKTDAYTTTYEVTEEDAASIMPDLTHDYAKMAERERLGYRSVAELVAGKYHMDVDFLKLLNPETDWSAGSSIHVINPGERLGVTVTRIVADKSRSQLLAYGEDDTLIASYPVTIGSKDTPSPEGSYEVTAIAMDPTFFYDPDLNFVRNGLKKELTLPPGPNGPVGTVWIDLDKETFGLHGSDDPNLVGKRKSHGCVRMTNWDAEELAHMVDPGVEVSFRE